MSGSEKNDTHFLDKNLDKNKQYDYCFKVDGEWRNRNDRPIKAGSDNHGRELNFLDV